MPTYMQTVAAHAQFEQIGKLIKTWATGTDFVKIPGRTFPKPTTIAELQEQLNGAGALVDVTRFTDLDMVQSNASTLVIRLPPAAFVAVNDAVVSDPSQNYPLPPFYQGAIQDPLSTYQGTADQRNLFDLRRIGDYSISYCC